MHWGFALMMWLMFAYGGTFFNPITMLLASIAPDFDMYLLKYGVKHRGFSHTIPAAFLFALPWILWDWWAVLSFFIGYMIHLGMDACTPMGIKWWKGHQRKGWYDRKKKRRII
jgi:membrane-bound metal-dependent hydrolase YbcI (DUF457 family)